MNTERGAATVEFALVASILLTLVFGIIQFGIFYSRYQVLQAAAREGARAAAVRGTGSEVTAAVRNAAEPYEISADPTVSVATGGSRCIDETTAGHAVTVSWTQRFDLALPFVPPINLSVPIRGVFRCE